MAEVCRQTSAVAQQHVIGHEFLDANFEQRGQELIRGTLESAPTPHHLSNRRYPAGDMRYSILKPTWNNVPARCFKKNQTHSKAQNSRLPLRRPLHWHTGARFHSALLHLHQASVTLSMNGITRAIATAESSSTRDVTRRPVIPLCQNAKYLPWTSLCKTSNVPKLSCFRSGQQPKISFLKKRLWGYRKVLPGRPCIPTTPRWQYKLLAWPHQNFVLFVRLSLQLSKLNMFFQHRWMHEMHGREKPFVLRLRYQPVTSPW